MSRRISIPVTAEHVEASLCETSCDGACCRAGVTIALYPDEAERMTSEYGAELEHQGTRPNLLGYGSYMFLSDCPNLTVTEQMGVCAVWGGDEWRPMICGDFKAGSPACDVIRLGGFAGGEDR